MEIFLFKGLSVEKSNKLKASIAYLLFPKLHLGMHFFEKFYFDSFFGNEVDEFEIQFL